MKTPPLSTLVFLVAAALPLQAESPRYGVQGLVTLPLRDLKAYVDSKPGPGIGIHGTFDLGDGHMLRPRLDYSVFPEVTLAGIKRNVSSISLGCDYLYFIAEKPEGFYFILGLAAANWSFDTKNDVSNITTKTTKLGLAAGGGYQWNATVGTDLRWLHTSVSSQFNADALQAGVTVRF